MKTFHVAVTKVDEALFSGEAALVIVPGIEGEMTIMPEHEAFISPLKEGTVTVRVGEENREFPIEKGLLEVSNNQATILV